MQSMRAAAQYPSPQYTHTNDDDDMSTMMRMVGSLQPTQEDESDEVSSIAISRELVDYYVKRENGKGAYHELDATRASLMGTESAYTQMAVKSDIERQERQLRFGKPAENFQLSRSTDPALDTLATEARAVLQNYNAACRNIFKVVGADLSRTDLLAALIEGGLLAHYNLVPMTGKEEAEFYQKFGAFQLLDDRSDEPIEIALEGLSAYFVEEKIRNQLAVRGSVCPEKMIIDKTPTVRISPEIEALRERVLPKLREWTHCDQDEKEAIVEEILNVTRLRHLADDREKCTFYVGGKGSIEIKIIVDVPSCKPYLFCVDTYAFMVEMRTRTDRPTAHDPLIAGMLEGNEGVFDNDEAKMMWRAIMNGDEDETPSSPLESPRHVQVADVPLEFEAEMRAYLAASGKTNMTRQDLIPGFIKLLCYYNLEKHPDGAGCFSHAECLERDDKRSKLVYTLNNPGIHDVEREIRDDLTKRKDGVKKLPPMLYPERVVTIPLTPEARERRIRLLPLLSAENWLFMDAAEKRPLLDEIVTINGYNNFGMGSEHLTICPIFDAIQNVDSTPAEVTISGETITGTIDLYTWTFQMHSSEYGATVIPAGTYQELEKKFLPQK